ncbi:MAG: preprotein translocase subunit SecE [Clostridiales bacterium GWE2_32_10]|nr:MAG: preprotein translocase subunit SecE [Clostridiales bacterium GWE2_32_10]
MAQTNQGEKKGSFFKNFKNEFNKIVWPSKEQVIKKTIVVLIISLVLMALVYGLDTLFNLIGMSIF